MRKRTIIIIISSSLAILVLALGITLFCILNSRAHLFSFCAPHKQLCLEFHEMESFVLDHERSHLNVRYMVGADVGDVVDYLSPAGEFLGGDVTLQIISADEKSVTYDIIWRSNGNNKATWRLESYEKTSTVNYGAGGSEIINHGSLTGGSDTIVFLKIEPNPFLLK